MKHKYKYFSSSLHTDTGHHIWFMHKKCIKIQHFKIFIQNHLNILIAIWYKFENKIKKMKFKIRISKKYLWTPQTLLPVDGRYCRIVCLSVGCEGGCSKWGLTLYKIYCVCRYAAIQTHTSCAYGYTALCVLLNWIISTGIPNYRFWYSEFIYCTMYWYIEICLPIYRIMYNC